VHESLVDVHGAPAYWSPRPVDAVAAAAPSPAAEPDADTLGGRLGSVALYGQQAELALLAKALDHLDRRTMIDVGAEQGGLADAMLGAGVELLHAFEPAPVNAAHLRTRFRADRRVVVHEQAISDGDGDATLRLSSHPDGSPITFGHTLLEREDTDEIAWRETTSVSRRSLASLIASEEIPERVGILKIDTEGHDLSVVRGMGALAPDIVMVEHWSDLPHGLGRCPWSVQDMFVELEPRGFAHFAFVAHRGELVTLKWDDAEIERGAMGNLIFLHQSVLARVAPEVLEVAGQLAEDAVRVAQGYMRAAQERLILLDELEAAKEA
jgi:FkbM family methyltransferase